MHQVRSLVWVGTGLVKMQINKGSSNGLVPSNNNLQLDSM